MSQCREKLKLLDTTFFCCLPEGHQCAHGYRFLQSDVERFAARAERAEADLAAARAEVERLRAGGCARNQRTTQWCAEAETLRQDLAAALAEVERLQVATCHPDIAAAWQRLGERAERAEADLAATRALLTIARAEMRDDGTGRTRAILKRIDAALAGGKNNGL